MTFMVPIIFFGFPRILTLNVDFAAFFALKSIEMG